MDYLILYLQNESIFQKYHNKINIADKYNLNTLGSENIGILNAFIELVQNCKTKYFIFSENDFLLLKNDYNISKTINDVCKY